MSEEIVVEELQSSATMMARHTGTKLVDEHDKDFACKFLDEPLCRRMSGYKCKRLLPPYPVRHGSKSSHMSQYCVTICNDCLPFWSHPTHVSSYQATCNSSLTLSCSMHAMHRFLLEKKEIIMQRMVQRNLN